MVGKVLEITDVVTPHKLAENITQKYSHWSQKRLAKEAEWKELRNYLFATDTTTTTNSQLPWKNKTTIPKLTQIRDNLHANYLSALFPNDDWLVWEGHTKTSIVADKRRAIEAYMKNKVRLSGFQKTISKLLYDYIDYGNAFGDVEYVHNTHVDPETDEIVNGYVGPQAVRTSPLDQVFNPAAASYEESPKITRYVKTLGELKVDAETMPELNYSTEVIKYAEEVRSRVASSSQSDIAKSAGYEVDGFDGLMDYYQSGFVEILEFEGDIHDESGVLQTNQIISVIDRTLIVRHETNPSWVGKDGKCHVGWRPRPDNLYAMGPLDNLVGMQYRIDHLENIKADLFDLIAHPPLKMKGNVEPFDWKPFAQIEVGDDGDIDTLKVDATALQADTQVAILEQKMEEMAGAPREAMGIRSPGEKTAYEVQKLDDAASRIFQEKIRQFEIFILEPLLNSMLEVARRNVQGSNLIRTMDDDIGAVQFINITRSDLSEQGKLRAKGASHFAARNLLVQNLTTVFNSRLGEVIMPHVSPKALAKLTEEAFGWEKFDLVRPNVAVMEQMETQRLVQSGEEQLEVEAQTPTEGEMPMEDPMMGGM